MNQLTAVRPTQQTILEAGAVWPRIEEMLDAGFSRLRLQAEAGVSASQLDARRKGVADGDVETRLCNWYNERKRKASHDGPGFIYTPTAQAIFQAFNEARSAPCLALVYGGAGVGKTIAAREFLDVAGTKASGSRSCFYVVAGAMVQNPTAILSLLAEAVGLTGGAYRSFGLARIIAKNLRPGDLVIVDEAQFLKANALDALRHFLDEHGVGIAYLGNEELYTQLHRAGRAARFAQLSSRVGVRLHVQSPTEADVDMLLVAWGISGRMEREFAVQLGTLSGGLRVLGRLFTNATLLADRMDQPIDVKILKAVARNSGDWRG